MIEEYKQKQELLREARDQRISELELQLEQLQKKLAQQSEVAHDNNGNIAKSRDKIYFDSVDEIYLVIRQLIKKEGVVQLLEQVKTFDKLKKGLIPELGFKAVLQKNNVRLKEGDYTMLLQSLYDRYNPNMVDIVRFYYGLTGKIDEVNQAHHKSCGSDKFEVSSNIPGSQQQGQSTGNMVDKKDLVELKK